MCFQVGALRWVLAFNCDPFAELAIGVAVGCDGLQPDDMTVVGLVLPDGSGTKMLFHFPHRAACWLLVLLHHDGFSVCDYTIVMTVNAKGCPCIWDNLWRK